MARVYNFSAGPSCIFDEVLKEASSQMLEYNNAGMSVMEMSHRSNDFEEIVKRCESNLRSLMMIPDNYEVLFLQGGASLQFSMIPMNLLRNGTADIVHTGIWTEKAIKELNRLGRAEVIASSEDKVFSYIPKINESMIHDDADYLYICQNNTIFGTVYKELPPAKEKPLVADLSSCILSEPIDVSKYGVIFAGAQKNMGIAGLTIVIIQKKLIEERKNIPSMLSYKVMADNKSMYNTPPTYAIYICDLILKHIIEKIGGLLEMQRINRIKADLLYSYLDNSSLFKNPVCRKDRSLMNVTFVTGDDNTDRNFILQAEHEGFVNLKGHRLAGGMRASIYNAMSIEGVKALISFMEEFERKR
ncbi:MAG: 3-phosphoserine/phosphohydroxythreonine transaminase [Clostridia bacterium]|jgi:phosphoserine aminotransferase